MRGWDEIEADGAIPLRRRAPEHRLATPYAWRDPATIPMRDWIYGREILRGHVRGLIAAGGAGKTILSVGEALAMATGRNLLGKIVPGGPKRVWLWNLEDDVDELGRIIQAACKHWNIGPDDFGDRLMVDSALDGKILKLATASTAEGLTFNQPLVDDLISELTEHRIDYLHVDPFVSSHAADESNNMQIDAIAKEWARVAKVSDSAIGLAHHTSKVGAGEVTALSARGAVALINACRSVLTINRMSDEEASRYGIEGEGRRRYFRTYDDKNNRKPPCDESDWFHMASVDLGNGGIGEGDNIGVVEPWCPPDPFDGLAGDHLYRVQKAVNEGRWREHHSSPDWVGFAVASTLGFDLNTKAQKSRILKMIKTWLSEGALKTVDGKDDRRKPVRFVEVGRWQNDTSAPPAFTGAERSGAVELPSAPLHPPPLRGGGGATGAGRLQKVEQIAPPHENPALKARKDPFDESQGDED